MTQVRHLALATLLAVALPSAPPPSAAEPDSSLVWRAERGRGYSLHYTPQDVAALPLIRTAVEHGRRRVESFFGRPFARPFDVRVFPDRASLDRWWQAAWHVPDLHTECWMVASGTGPELDVLSPLRWQRDACEHDATDTLKTRRLLTHELVHVYHGQYNPRPDFDGLDAIAWFAEGLATYASGQLEADHRGAAHDAIASGNAPVALEKAWTGRYRYGVSGSLVAFVDRGWGRRTVVRMLSDTTQAQLLGRLGLSEPELLRRWRERETR